MADVTLFLGGARSGKSSLALKAAEACTGQLTYLATGQAFDAEMTERIRRHRAERGPRWTTIECPVDLPRAIIEVETGAVVVDCLTLWLSNLMLGDHDVGAARAALIAAIGAVSRPMFIVSNEVGSGIVPDSPLGRAFRDEAGRLNQDIACIASRTLLIVAGLVLPLERFDLTEADA